MQMERASSSSFSGSIANPRLPSPRASKLPSDSHRSHGDPTQGLRQIQSQILRRYLASRKGLRERKYSGSISGATCPTNWTWARTPTLLARSSSLAGRPPRLRLDTVVWHFRDYSGERSDHAVMAFVTLPRWQGVRRSTALFFDLFRAVSQVPLALDLA